MTYLEKLSPWCIIKLLPSMQRLTVARFRRRGDAEAHLRILHRLIPHANFTIIYDPVLSSQTLPADNVTNEIDKYSNRQGD
ncbi:MAG: hypothetical protein F6J96_09480 [Symploca sp. SIO1C2]|nr:hypothetical protein [Symploca sp. SIO1C2]NER45178.1 hypothetical protein [Symploca sp. SIO1A3]